jgi:hypothetical protein
MLAKYKLNFLCGNALYKKYFAKAGGVWPIIRFSQTLRFFRKGARFPQNRKKRVLRDSWKWAIMEELGAPLTTIVELDSVNF